jgi:hypothetical protein
MEASITVADMMAALSALPRRRTTGSDRKRLLQLWRVVPCMLARSVYHGRRRG